VGTNRAMEVQSHAKLQRRPLGRITRQNYRRWWGISRRWLPLAPLCPRDVGAFPEPQRRMVPLRRKARGRAAARCRTPDSRETQTGASSGAVAWVKTFS